MDLSAPAIQTVRSRRRLNQHTLFAVGISREQEFRSPWPRVAQSRADEALIFFAGKLKIAAHHGLERTAINALRH